MPKVSVIMGVYNGAETVSSAIESILNQTFRDFEFIICNDCSTDNTPEIIKEYKKLDQRIFFLTNQINSGLAYSLNKCIEIACGEYIARMDADDISLADRFEKQVRFLDGNPHIDLISGNVHLFDENGIWGLRTSKKNITKKILYRRNPIIHPTVMMRTGMVKKVGGYAASKDTLRIEDFDLWCRIYSQGYLAYNTGDFLLNYRESHNFFEKTSYRSRIGAYRITKKWRKKLGLPFYYEIYAYRHLMVGLIPRSLLRIYHRIKDKTKTTASLQENIS